MTNYYVICREDDNRDGSKGKYVLATSRTFVTFDLAEDFAESINPKREPKILMEVFPLYDDDSR